MSVVEVKCTCCGHITREYHRKFNSNMALAAMFLYSQRFKSEYVHLENAMREKGYKRCGDASYLVHYNIIKKMDKDREDGSPRNGMYRLTSIGMMFVEGLIPMQDTFVMANGELQKLEGKQVYIQDVLGKKFDYSELMRKLNECTASPERIS